MRITRVAAVLVSVVLCLAVPLLAPAERGAEGY